MALEQSGPWGAKAFTASHLDPGDRPRPSRRQRRRTPCGPCWCAGPDGTPTSTPSTAATRDGCSWRTRGRARPGCCRGTVAAPEDVLALDWAALRDGDLDAVRRSLPSLTVLDRPQLLVCTNGTRDVCCAVRGRPVALGGRGAAPGPGLGGHAHLGPPVRPHRGAAAGRDAARVARPWTGAAALLAEADRGRDGARRQPGPVDLARSRPGRRAGRASRHRRDRPRRPRRLRPHGRPASTPGPPRCATPTAGEWQVDVVSEPTGQERAESCGKAATGLRRWRWTVAAAAE